MTRQEGYPEDRGSKSELDTLKSMPESSVQELDELPPDAAIAADRRNSRRRNREAQQEEEPEVGVLVQSEPRHELAELILHAGVKQQILDGLRAIQIRDQLEEVWSISRLQPQQGRCILKFLRPARNRENPRCPGRGASARPTALSGGIQCGVLEVSGRHGQAHQAGLRTGGRPITGRCCSSTRPTAFSPSGSVSMNRARPRSTRTGIA